MTISSCCLDELMLDLLQPGGFMVQGDRDFYMEVLDSASGQVWMSAAPVTRAQCATLTLPAGLIPIGFGRASMNRALFQCSPGVAAGEGVRQKAIDGRLFINVARPLEQTKPAEPGGAVHIRVDKSHVIGFDAGRSVSVLHVEGKYYVELVGDAANDAALILPQGGEWLELTLHQPWVIELPAPTHAYFWSGENLRSFQGPVTLPREL